MSCEEQHSVIDIPVSYIDVVLLPGGRVVVLEATEFVPVPTELVDVLVELYNSGAMPDERLAHERYDAMGDPVPMPCFAGAMPMAYKAASDPATVNASGFDGGTCAPGSGNI